MRRKKPKKKPSKGIRGANRGTGGSAIAKIRGSRRRRRRGGRTA